jgi:hypothetical protein
MRESRRSILPAARAFSGKVETGFPKENATKRSRGEDKALRALAALGDDELCNLSEAGQRLRRKALQMFRTAAADRSPRRSRRRRLDPWAW